MKRILIAGANSYIGTSLEQYLLEYNAAQGRELYRVDTVSQRDAAWENLEFVGYDAVFQASGIAHVDTGELTQEQQTLYYRVNCDLAVATARKAQEAGVGLFLYPSSIIVYGDSAPYRKKRGITGGITGVITGVITPETPVDNSHFYGNSKIRAEEELRRLVSESKEDSAVSGGDVQGGAEAKKSVSSGYFASAHGLRQGKQRQLSSAGQAGGQAAVFSGCAESAQHDLH